MIITPTETAGLLGCAGSDPVSASAPNEIIHQSLRLRVIATLRALPASEPIEFTRLRALLAATDGNLGAHLTTLENAGSVRVDKDFAGRRPRTRIAITPAGRTAYDAHVLFLRTLLDAPPTALAAE